GDSAAEARAEFANLLPAIRRDFRHSPGAQLSVVTQRMNDEITGTREQLAYRRPLSGTRIENFGITIQAFIESVFRELLHQIKNLVGVPFLDPVLRAAFHEPAALLRH